MARQLLKGMLPFRGHDESESLTRKGHFLNFLEWHAESNKNVRSVEMTSTDIQKDIAHYFAKETIGKMLEELGDGYFAILVDESRDVSYKQQMASVLRYVDRMGFVMEQFLSLVHITDTSSLSLNENIYSLLSQYSFESILHKRTRV